MPNSSYKLSSWRVHELLDWTVNMKHSKGEKAFTFFQLISQHPYHIS